ncbi:hypothetical protein FHL15_006836 [Xylaria flabelliformis]|uniref:Uncharacterized protein n=1 Tax=Xylaria flabelliformis TaxID=2512241 RepID=A0A553HW85_9PEZI|nr:hypothetical protein FHL15_006836 [Xylaria flabelliformis]
MATPTQYAVHVGLWTNWSHGKVFGATLTLTKSDGALLTAFLALTVTVIGTQLWRVFCFVTHYLLSSTNEPGDALYHQIQTTLRNTSEPTGGVINFLLLGKAWNKRGVHVLRRIIPVLMITIIITVGTAISSGFSSKIAVGSEVLLRGNNCAWVEINGNTDAVDEYTVVSPYTNTKLQVDATSVHNLSDSRSTTRYFFGPHRNSDTNNGNHTYEVSNDAYSDRDALGDFSGFPKYSIRPYTAAWENGSLANWGTLFEPIPELTVTDADLKLLFLAGNGIYFTNVTNDPWYKATTPGPISHPLVANESSAIQVYRQDNPGSPMGCVHRSQYCRAGPSGGSMCTDLTGELDLYYSVMSVFDDEHAFNRVNWFQTMVDASWWLEDIVGRGDVNLAAQYRVRSGVQGPLPDDQWQLEVQYWFSIMLASMQRTFVDTATGPSDVNLKQYRVPPANADEQNLCVNQKILSSDHTSFSVFGLLFIFTFGGIIVFLGLTLDSIVAFIQRHRRSDPHRRLEWGLNETLQLQRLAHEALGHSTWTDCTKSVPITTQDAFLGKLDVSDLNHPSWKPVEKLEKIPSGDSQSRASSSETDSMP